MKHAAYFTPEGQKLAGANAFSAYDLAQTYIFENDPKYFAAGTHAVKTMDNSLWPEIIASRIRALLFWRNRTPSEGRNKMPDCWRRIGMVFDIPKSELADTTTIAPDVRAFYQGAEMERLEPWFPEGLDYTDIGKIIDIVASDDTPSRKLSLPEYREQRDARRALLHAVLPKFYERYESQNITVKDGEEENPTRVEQSLPAGPGF